MTEMSNKEREMGFQLQSDSVVYSPGQEIIGEITIEPQAETTVDLITIGLFGVCTTRTKKLDSPVSSSSSPRENRLENRFEEEYFFLACDMPVLVESKSFCPGTHLIPCAIRIPFKCVSGSNSHGPRTDWDGLPLPSSFMYLSHNCAINYYVRVTVKLSGDPQRYHLFNTIAIASIESQNPMPCLVQDRVSVEREMIVKFYDCLREAPRPWVQRVLRHSSCTHNRRLMVRLTHSAAGLPSWDCPLEKVASLVVYRVCDGEDKTDREFVVRKVVSRMIYTIIASTSYRTRKYSTEVVIHETPELAEKPLRFRVDSDGRHFCNISKHLSPSASQTSPVNFPFTTIRTPNIRVSTTLQVELCISSGNGDRSKASTLVLESPVSIYNTEGNKIPEGAEMLPVEELSPPLYDA